MSIRPTTPEGGTSLISAQLDKARVVIERLALIDPKYRDFSVTTKDAERWFGFSFADLETLRAFGLRSSGDHPVRTYDWGELVTLASHLRMRSGHRAAMRYWLRTLEGLSKSRMKYRIEVEAVVEDPDLTPLQVLGSDGRYTTVLTQSGRVSRQSWVSLELCTKAVTPMIAALLEEYSDIDHYFLPRALSNDATIYLKHRIADCRSFAYFLSSAARREGIPCRESWGLIVSYPYSTPHAWVEFLIDGTWVAIDVFMARALREWGLSDLPLLELATLLGSLYSRWSATPVPFACPADTVRHTTFRTSRMTTGVEIPTALAGEY